MAKEWLLLLGIIAAIYLNSPGTLAKHTNFATDGAPSPRGSDSSSNSSEGKSVARVKGSRSIGTELSEVIRSLVQRVAAIPLSIGEMVIDSGKRIVINFVETTMATGWKVTKNHVVPWVDKICVKVAGYESVPKNMRSALMSAHSAYKFMQIFGYLKVT